MEGFYRNTIDAKKLPGVIREKWRENVEILDEGVIPLPKRVMRILHRVLPATNRLECFQMLMAVIDFRRPAGRSLPSKDFLSFVSGLSLVELEEALDLLEKAHLINVTVVDGRLSVSIDGLVKKVMECTKTEKNEPIDPTL